MNNKYLIGGISAVVVLLIIGGVMLLKTEAPQQQKSQSSTSTSLGAQVQNDNWVFTGQVLAQGGSGAITVPAGSSMVHTNKETYVAGATITRTSTTTIFAIPNPFFATSTVSSGILFGLMGSSTVDILVGTSSQITGTLVNGVPTCGANGSTITNNNQISTSLFNVTTIATGTPFYSQSGVLVGSAGYNTPGVSSQGSIVISPTDCIVGLATSTYAGSSAVGNSGIIGSPLTSATGTNITYSFTFTR